MATFAFAQIVAAIGLFSSLLQQGGSTPRYQRNLQWLVQLRARASSKMAMATTAEIGTSQQGVDLTRLQSHDDREDGDDGEDVELLGWRTRLIERVGQNCQTSTTIRLNATTPGSHITNVSTPPANSFDTVIPNAPTLRWRTPADSTDNLVRRTCRLLKARANVT